MTYTYELRLDEPYFRTMLDRYYRQRPILLRPQWQLAFLGVLVLAVSLWMPFEGNRVVVTLAMLVVYCMVAAAGLAGLRALVLQDHRYSSYFGGTSLCKISDLGLHVSGAWPEHTVAWAALKSAARFRDGMILLRFVPDRAFGGFKYSACWLPDAALRESSPSDVDRYVRTKIRVRDVA
jgi:hypothetical protein